MSRVDVRRDGERLIVRSPYHPDFPTGAKKLGGRWKSDAWVFDARDEERVRALCVEVYGEDGTPQELVSLRVDIDGITTYGRETSIFVAGREIVRVRGRDSGAVLGEGVVVLEGDFTSGGSRKNPAVEHDPGTVVEVRDVPRAAAEAAVDEYGVNVSILEPDDADDTALAKLAAERAQLIERLAEVDARIEALSDAQRVAS